jgi:ribose-phosphate pyrophosphokinase
MPSTVDDSIRIFSGNAHLALAEEVASYLGVGLASRLSERFADGEVRVAIDESVRGKDVYVLQSLCRPVNDQVMELLVMVDALRRSSARTVTAVLPYYAYARQDRQDRPRTPITAKLLADLIVTSGVDRVMAMDLHAAQIQGFFQVPVEHLYASKVLVNAMRDAVDSPTDEIVVVAPDAGGVERARWASKKLGTGLAIIDKRRSKPNVAEVMHVIGDVEGCDALIVDDMIDTAGTLCSAARALRENGARRVFAFATHGLLNGPAVERIEASVLERVYVANTVPLHDQAAQCAKIEVVSVGPTIGEAIKRVHVETSVSSLWV